MRGQVYRTRLPKYVTNFNVPYKKPEISPGITGNDRPELRKRKRNIAVSVFTANHFWSGPNLEDAIGRIASRWPTTSAEKPAAGANPPPPEGNSVYSRSMANTMLDGEPALSAVTWRNRICYRAPIV